jgi:Ala-tRNA(Pro) deacylase
MVNTELFTEKPDCTDRLPKEERVYDLLHTLAIPFVGVDHDVAPTIEACREIESVLGVMPCKNLFLRNRQKTEFYLLLMPGDKKFVTKNLSHQLQISRLSFAEPEFMEKFLDITPGSASILGLMNDSERRVHLLIDDEILAEESIGCHPCINTSSLKIQTADILEKFITYTRHPYTAVHL